MRRLTKVIVAVFLAVIFGYLLYSLRTVELHFHTELIDFEAMTKQMNIQNIVSAIYLGPRIFDTFLEVLVVVLTVYGMKFIKSRDERQ